MKFFSDRCCTVPCHILRSGTCGAHNGDCCSEAWGLPGEDTSQLITPEPVHAGLRVPSTYHSAGLECHSWTCCPLLALDLGMKVAYISAAPEHVQRLYAVGKTATLQAVEYGCKVVVRWRLSAQKLYNECTMGIVSLVKYKMTANCRYLQDRPRSTLGTGHDFPQHISSVLYNATVWTGNDQASSAHSLLCMLTKSYTIDLTRPPPPLLWAHIKHHSTEHATQ